MKDGLYHQLNEIENTHWWHISRRKLIDELLSEMDVDHQSLALDIGCGIGGNMSVLEKFTSRAIGMDYSELALSIARKKYPQQEFILGDANNLYKNFRHDRFGLISIFNVLYHEWIKNEIRVLEQVFTLLNPGGYLIITEPAHEMLRRRHDEQGMGKSRYQLSVLSHLISEVGLDVQVGTYFNSVCFLPALVLKGFEFLKKKKPMTSDENVKEMEVPPEMINSMMIRILDIERLIIKKCGGVPFGVTALAIARKPL